MANILVVDDDKNICLVVDHLIRQMGHEVETAHTLAEGRIKAAKQNFAAILLDVNLPDGNGLSSIPDFRDLASNPQIIIITGEGSMEGAELAIEAGAWDYIQKPLTATEIIMTLKRVLQYTDEKQTPKTSVILNIEGIIGQSPLMKRSYDLLAKAAAHDSTVLITGETGTGKELFARAIHANSSRHDCAFVVIDCASLPETLVESTLFGHEKGAFTGAEKKKNGLIKEADGGTLFLDEVGELPLTMQKSLLRVLQEKSFRPVGSNQELQSDFRLIAATNRDLADMAAQGHFRKDLLFRLQTINIDLPPLRKRAEDIGELALHYIKQFSNRYGLGIKGISPEFLSALGNYSWPGNVRELINALERALSLAKDDATLFPIHLPPALRKHLARETIVKSKEAINTPLTATDLHKDLLPLRELLEETEKQYLVDLIAFTRGDIPEACRISGISRTRLYEKLKKFAISAD
jgi:two-component system NtrC family response regulator